MRRKEKYLVERGGKLFGGGSHDDNSLINNLGKNTLPEKSGDHLLKIKGKDTGAEEGG